MNKQLLEKYYRDECSEDECQQILQWLHDPANQDQVREWMREYWSTLDVTKAPIPDLNRIWKDIDQRLFIEAEPTVVPLEAPVTRRWTTRIGFRITASLVLICLSTFLIYQYLTRETQVVYQTHYGQVLTVNLPDHSQVTLNGNSSLRWKSNWSQTRAREVWLDGEAFFSVKHQLGEQKFLVHTSSDLTVEVVGTQFSVFKEAERTRVVLNSGKINLRIEKNILAKPQQFEIQPGELVEFDDRNRQLSRKSVNPRVYSSWKDQQLVFDNTPLTEVVTRLKATYGLKVQIDEQAQQKRLTGKVDVENLDVLLEAMASSFHLKITRQNNTIYIQSTQ